MTRAFTRATTAAALSVLAAILLAPSAGASSRLLIGLYDETQTLQGNPASTFRLMRTLRTQVVRTNLYWGSRLGAVPPRAVVPKLDDPADFGRSKQPSVGIFGLGGDFRVPDNPKRFSYALLQAAEHEKARALRTASPETRVLASKHMGATFSFAAADGVDHEILPSGVGYEFSAKEHPEWFLTTTADTRVESCVQQGRWLMDVGNAEYQAAWIENVARELKDRGWSGVFVDGASASVADHLCNRTLAKYATDADYAAAVEAFLARVGPALAERGFLVVLNMRVPANATGLGHWQKWISFASGGAYEGWTKTGRETGGQVSGDAWAHQQELLRVTEAANKVFLGLTYGPGGDVQSRRYARASFLLGWNAGSSALVYVPEAGDAWSPESAVEMGLPTGAAKLQGGVWRREFQEGTVLVNPSSAPVTVALDTTHITPSGQVVDRITLAAASGVSLRFPDYVGGNDVGVARRRPRNPADPADSAYNWSLYDRAVLYANAHRIQLVFSIMGTPRWANAGKGFRYAPTNFGDLLQFSYAAARRYSGTYRGPDGRFLPAVKMWLAWNEPNNPVFLRPQYARVGGRWVVQSARDYAKICDAVFRGVHLTLLRGEKVGCGVTAPRGGGGPTSKRPSVTPVRFLRAVKQAGMRRFDVYAHHPYYNLPSEAPNSKPKTWGAVTLGNIDKLVKELTKLYGQKRLWITEYGYQTWKPDRKFGVTWATQAKYLKQAYAIARKHKRIDMMLWFLLKDDPRLAGWQSGFFTAKGKRKPAFDAFRKLPR